MCHFDVRKNGIASARPSPHDPRPRIDKLSIVNDVRLARRKKKYVVLSGRE